MSTHKHKCGCGHLWEHDPLEIATPVENKEAHTCEKCGTEVWAKYHEGEDPSVMCRVYNILADICRKLAV